MVTRVRLGPRQIQLLRDSIPPQFKTPDGQTEALSLASGILRQFMGAAWVEQHLISDGYKKGFLSLDKPDPPEQEIAFFRVMDLAEVLYNLQHTPGFDECIDRMRQGDIEGTLAELDFARMLFLNKVPFRFVIAQGVKKLDYDFDIICPNGMVACADSKCKIDTTEFSENGLRNVLKHARSQLPNKLPGIVFIKVPERWLSQPEFQEKAIPYARRFLGGVTRIVSVKFYANPITYQDNVMRIDLAYKEVSNSKTDFGNDVDWNIFKKHSLPPDSNGMPDHWDRIILGSFRTSKPGEGS